MAFFRHLGQSVVFCLLYCVDRAAARRYARAQEK